MEEPHAGLAEAAVAREERRLAGVAEQHVGPLHLAHGNLCGAGEGVLQLALQQADAQVAAEHELDQVLRLQRRSGPQEGVQDWALLGWPAGDGQGGVCLHHLRQSEGG